MNGRVVVVDDEKNITFVLHAILKKAGFDVLLFNDSTLVPKCVFSEPLDAVITDLNMPGMSGMELLDYCQTHKPKLPVVMITAFGTVESAVSALKRGAFDYITKPFDQTELLNVVQKAVATSQRNAIEPDLPGSSIIGSSPQMLEIFRMIQKIAKSPSTVLIEGESGTGKELIAFEIHRLSLRAKKPFIKINCAAIPSTLIESELFGYEKGAFTGAMASKLGRFELANEGTVFLDEVGEMPLEMQVKLLRVLQEQEFERVGGVTTTRVDVRIITATNKDLGEEVKKGRFREDLYYRLNVVPIHLPPLRERKEDIESLIHYFLKQFNKKLEKTVQGLESSCLAQLKNFSWPGNIRQLENVMERMILMSDTETLSLLDLPDEVTGIVSSGQLEGDLTNFKKIVRKQTRFVERELIEKALDETVGNVTRAAEKLGLSRKGLQIKMKELGLRTPKSIE